MPKKALMSDPAFRETLRDIPGPAPHSDAFALSARNTVRWPLTTVLIAALTVHVVSAIACFAQTLPQETSPVTAQPDPAQMIQAIDRVRSWLANPDAKRTADASRAFALRDASAVCVILRHNGRVLGIGDDAHGDDWMLLRAADAAIEKMLNDPVIAGMSQEVRSLIGQSLCVEIEAAGTPTPLIGRTIPQLSLKLEPALDGYALRRNDQWYWLFPAPLRATNTADDLNGRMLGLAMKSGLQAGDLRDLSKKTDTTFYRFRTVHAVQIASGQTPFQTYRGQALVFADSINRQSIRALADGLASHLQASMWPDPPVDPNSAQAAAPPVRKPLGLMGDYRVVADDYRPMIAAPLEQALAAFGLLRYSAVPEINLMPRLAARHSGRQLLIDLSVVAEGEQEFRHDAATCAAIVYAMTASPELLNEPALHTMWIESSNVVLNSYDRERANFKAVQADGREVELSAHAQALIAGAMCRLLVMRQLEQVKTLSPDPIVIRMAMDRAWSSVFEPQRVALLPWIGWAEADYARAESQPLAHVADLKKILVALDKARLGPGAEQRPLDLWGGFEFTGEDGTMGPDSQTARPAAWVGSILIDPRLVPVDQQAAALDRHLQTMRFLTQLTIREPDRYSLRSPAAAMGGIRASLWNSHQPVAAQALALLAAVETLIGLERPTVEPANP